MKRIIAVLAAFMAALCASAVRAQDQGGDYSKVTNVPRDAIESWLKDQAKQSNGDWDNGRFSIYVGFATAGYAQDPVAGISMRRVAFDIMNRLLAAGDEVTPLAFEMQVNQFGDTITLTKDKESREKFVSGVPYTPKPDSVGGHDIERALDETLKRILPNANGSSIILLLNKDNASQDPNGVKDRLYGEKNPELLKDIKHGGFRPIERKVFQMQANGNPVQVAVTALFPQKLVSLPGSFGPRYPTFAPESWQPAADNPNPPPPPVGTSSGNGTGGGGGPPPAVGRSLWWLWALLAVIVLGVILYMVMSKRSVVQRPLAPAAMAAAPKIETLPGALRVIIGPDEQMIAPLPKSGVWSLARMADGSVKLVDKAAKPAAPAQGAAAPAAHVGVAPDAAAKEAADAGTSLAKLTFAEDRSLRAEAESGAQFSEIQGTAADKCDSRSMVIEPGKRALCRVLPPDSSTKTRFEIVYDTQSKGGKV